MEPFKALVLLASAAVVSLVGAGAAGFYAGYSAGRGNLEEIKAHISGAQALIPAGEGGAVSMKPLFDDVRALSKQVEALAAAKASGPAGEDSGTKLILDEIKSVSSQIDGLRQVTLKPMSAPPAVSDRPACAAAPAPDYTDTLQDIREQVRALNVKVEKQEPKAPKALMDDIRSLSASIQAQEPGLRRALAEEVRSAVSSLQSEQKAPKTLVEELKSLNSALQSQEPNLRRAVADEVRSAVATLQGTEPKVPKAILEEIRAIAATVKTQEARPQAAQSPAADQIKALQASIEALKAKLSEDRARSESAASADIAQLRQLVASASDQFSRCQTQLASFSAPALAAPPQQAAATAAITVSQDKKTEPASVVFYDNVMLKKDQERQYDEIGVKLALQSVGSRQVRVAVNRQGFGLSFGERKVFRSQDVECEINLMETNLNDSQARISISCKR